MAKVNFTKIETMLSEALRKILIDRLSELASIMMLIRDPNTRLPKNKVEEIIKHFREELKALKEKDTVLYQRLAISSQMEEKFHQTTNFTSEDWQHLKELKERIDALKRELYGQTQTKEEDEARIAQERIKHVNKRFNIRENWLPLH